MPYRLLGLSFSAASNQEPTHPISASLRSSIGCRIVSPRACAMRTLTAGSRLSRARFPPSLRGLPKLSRPGAQPRGRHIPSTSWRAALGGQDRGVGCTRWHRALAARRARRTGFRLVRRRAAPVAEAAGAANAPIHSGSRRQHATARAPLARAPTRPQRSADGDHCRVRRHSGAAHHSIRIPVALIRSARLSCSRRTNAAICSGVPPTASGSPPESTMI